MDQERFRSALAHQPRLIRRDHAHRAVHGAGPLGRANTWVALRVTGAVGSMWCAYVFAAIALVSLPAALRTGDQIIIVAWIAQTFLQLVLLPIIIVGQNVQAAASEARAEGDHETLSAIHALAAAVRAINEGQNLILERLDQRTQRPSSPAP